MTKDIAPELYEKISAEISGQIEKSQKIKELYELIYTGKADYVQANEFSQELGEIYAAALKNNLSSGVLPDGKMYYNIAERTIRPALTDCYGKVSDANVHIQKALNDAAGIGINAIKPEMNEERVSGIINKVTSADNFDDVAWVLDEPVKNFAQSIVDDSVRANADFHNRAGLNPKITRTVSGKCCDWCSALAGTYNYGEEPKDIYRRHEYCRCMVLYDPGTGKLQNAHTKKWVDPKYDIKTDVKKIVGLKSNGIIIKSVSTHIYDRMEERAVEADNIRDAILNPLKIKPVKYDEFGRPSFTVIGEKATVCINPETGVLTTTHPTHSKTAKKLKEENK